MSEDGDQRVPRLPVTGVNDHAWEREHRTPSTQQMQAIGYRRRDAEAKLEQHLQAVRRKDADAHDDAENSADT